MKKTVLLVAVAIILSTLYLVPSTAFAQTFTAEKAFSDYQYQLSIYQQDYSDFQDAKTFYLSNPTLQLKEQARQKTLKMLKDRDRLMAVYLTAIRLQIVDSNGFNQDQRNVIFGKIDPEVAWYQNHINTYSDSDELAVLFTKSDECKNRYQTNTLAVIDEGLIDIGLTQEIGLRLSHQQIYSDLKNYINDQVAAGKLKIDPFNRWLDDTDTVLAELQKNEVSAAAKIQELNNYKFAISSSYEDAIKILFSSVAPLSQLNSYLTEMLTTIQNQ